MPGENPYAKYVKQAAPAGDPVIARDPYKQAAEARANEDQQIQRTQLGISQRSADRQDRTADLTAQKTQLEIDKLKKESQAQLDPKAALAIREEARAKIKLIDSLKSRSKNGWFATGFGSGVASSINGTTASDVAKDVQTVAAAGALQRIMEMAKANGGKNPLTPLSNADFQALGQSIANLDPGLSDERFQENLDVYRDIYLRAFKAAGGTTTGGKGQAKKRLRYNPATGELE